MRTEKHVESIREAMDEIEKSLEDPKGLLLHQRRLAAMLSIGVCDLIEIYFHRLKIMKEGSRIKHQFLRKADVKERLSNQITSPLQKVKRIDEILKLAVEIEEKRDDLAYGSPLTDEKFLKEKIDQFLDLKRIIESETGDIFEKRHD